MVVLGGNFFFIYTGEIKFNDIDNFLGGEMKDSPFRLQFKIPINLGTIRNSKPEIIKDKKNGLCILTYQLYETNDEAEEICDL